jgi:beta-glucosidase
VAEEAITLLKNKRTDGSPILPLSTQHLKTLAVIGPAATDMAISGGGSALVEPPHRMAPLAALRRALVDKLELRHEPGADNWVDLPVLKPGYLTPALGEGHGLYGEYFSGPNFEGEPFMKRVDPRLDYWWFSAGPASGIGARFCVRWQGRLEVPASGRYTLRLSNTGSARLFLDGRQVSESSRDPASFSDIAGAETVIALDTGRAYDLRVELVNAQSGQFTHLRVSLGLRPESDDRIERAVALARDADVVLVMVGGNEQYEAEGSDRSSLHLPGRQDELVQRVAEANPNTVVVLNVGAPVEMPWLDRVAAVVQAYYPGMEGGQAIANVLTGQVNPSGRLTATYPRRLEDTPSYPNLSYPGAREVRYGEGIFVGYRYYDMAKVEPLFPFGHGLSYTTFYYSNLWAPAEVKPGASFEVGVDITNTGEAAGKEVVQLYVRDVRASVARPDKELKGFQKVALEPGETQTVRFQLDPRSLSFYDVVSKAWVAEPGAFEILVGASSADIRGRVEVRLAG